MEYLLLEDLEREKMITLGRGNIISKIDINAIPGNYPIYSSSATGNGEFGRYGKYMFEDERVTWSIDGGGRPFYREKHKYSVTNVCGWLKINTDKLITKFVYYCLLFQWNMLKFDYTYKAHPSIIKEIYRIPMLPISIQKVIVEQLDKINNQISKNTNTLLYFEELTKSRFNELFGDPLLNEYNFKTKELSKLTPFNSIKNTVVINSNTWLLNLDMIESDTGRIIEKVRTEEIGNSTIEFDTTCVLYSKLRPYLNKVAIPDENGIGTSELISMKCDSTIVTREYLASSLRHKSFVNYINSKTGGAKMPRANMDELRSFKMPIPPIELQNEFSSFVDQIDKLKFNVQKQIKYYQELLDLKMHEYFDVEEED